MEPKPGYTLNGKPIEQRCETVTMPVAILRAIYHMQMLRNDGRAEVLVRLSDWRIVEDGSPTAPGAPPPKRGGQGENIRG